MSVGIPSCCLDEPIYTGREELEPRAKQGQKNSRIV